MTSPRRLQSPENNFTSLCVEDRLALVDRVRGWELSFDGSQNPLDFTDRAEELAEIYGVSTHHLPQIMPLLLDDKALIWFRNNHKHWPVWSSFKTDFLEFFLSSRYLERLEDKVCKRIQHPEEPFKDYLLSLQNLMRHLKLSEDQKLERIYRNSHTNYRFYIRRKDFSSLQELISLAEDFGTLMKTSPQNQEKSFGMLTDSNNLNDHTRYSCYRCRYNKNRASYSPNNTTPTNSAPPQIKTYCEDGDAATNDSTIKSKPTFKCKWLHTKMQKVRECPQSHQNYKIIENKLYRRFTNHLRDKNSSSKVCVAGPLRDTIIQNNHGSSTSKHLSIRKTIKNISKCYYWPGMARDVRRYVHRLPKP